MSPPPPPMPYFTSEGNITILGGITVIQRNNQFIFTCISTGGPATTVTWTRDSTTVTEGTETVLNDPVTAQYTHTLTVTGRAPGIYTCIVTNNKPSSDSVSTRVEDATVKQRLQKCKKVPSHHMLNTVRTGGKLRRPGIIDHVRIKSWHFLNYNYPIALIFCRSLIS